MTRQDGETAPDTAGPCAYCDTTAARCVSGGLSACCRLCSHPEDMADQLAGSVSGFRLPTLRVDPEQLANVSRAFADLRVQLAALAETAELAGEALEATTKAWRAAHAARLEDDGEDGGE